MDLTIPLNWESIEGVIIFFTAGWTAWQQWQHKQHYKALANKVDVKAPGGEKTKP